MAGYNRAKIAGIVNFKPILLTENKFIYIILFSDRSDSGRFFDRFFDIADWL
jgi:hypothetical protein